MRAAYLEGILEGEKRGAIKVIHICDEVLVQPQTPVEHLLRLPLEELTRLAEDFQSQLRQRL
jgi:hypothetical protein